MIVYSFVGFKNVTSKGVGPHHIEMNPSVIPISMDGVSSSDEDIKKEFQKQKDEQEKISVLEKESGNDKEEFWIVEDLAHYPGGRPALKRYLEDNIQYPDNAREGQVKVMVQFTIRTDGSVADVKLQEKGAKKMDKEAIRLVSEMPDWIPAKQRDKRVSSEYIVPVVFAKTF
jgi:TonB family protein